MISRMFTLGDKLKILILGIIKMKGILKTVTIKIFKN